MESTSYQNYLKESESPIFRIAGWHCVRHPEEEASKVVLWQPARGITNRGRRHYTFIDNLRKDTGLESVSEIKTAMMDKAT